MIPVREGKLNEEAGETKQSRPGEDPGRQRTSSSSDPKICRGAAERRVGASDPGMDGLIACPSFGSLAANGHRPRGVDRWSIALRPRLATGFAFVAVSAALALTAGSTTDVRRTRQNRANL